MPQQVNLGATMTCTMGIGSSTLAVIPSAATMAEGKPAATIMDFAPMVNIPPFSLCNSPANPTVIAATAAKAGIFTPAACIPATVAPWAPGASTVLIGNMPALDNVSTCMCMWGGVISFASAGTSKTNIP